MNNLLQEKEVCGVNMVVGRWKADNGMSGNEFGICQSPKPCPLHEKVEKPDDGTRDMGEVLDSQEADNIANYPSHEENK